MRTVRMAMMKTLPRMVIMMMAIMVVMKMRLQLRVQEQWVAGVVDQG